MIFVGDIHEKWNHLTSLIRKFNIADEVLIQVGDFGIGFRSAEKDKRRLRYLNKVLKTRNIQLYVVRGNHDNPSFFDGSYEDKFPNVHLVRDYQIKTIQGYNVLFIGGAISVDRIDRKEGLDYWEDEVFNFDEEKLEAIEGVDIVVTHSAPKNVYPHVMGSVVEKWSKKEKGLKTELIKERQKLLDTFEILNKKNNIKTWCYGHFHESYRSKYKNTNFALININEMYEYIDDNPSTK